MHIAQQSKFSTKQPKKKMTSSDLITHSTCEIAFEWKGGRRLANNQDVAYILPSDQTEVDRLKLNHTLWV